MIAETLGFLACIFILSLIGLGPALRLVAAGEKRIAYALAVAPAVGHAMIGLIAFPLVRYLAPVQRWALPVTAALSLISVALMADEYRVAYHPIDYYQRIGKSKVKSLGVMEFILIARFELLQIGTVAEGVLRKNAQLKRPVAPSHGVRACESSPDRKNNA